MINGEKVTAMIPVRGKSRGLPGKNIKPFCGKPLIGWTIEQAQQSRFVDEIIVSTDDDMIADVSRRFGAEVPFIRPAELATDDSVFNDVVAHALDWLESNGRSTEIIIGLQVTSPLRTTEDIDAAIDKLSECNAGAVISVCPSEHSPCWANTLPADGCMKDFIRSEFITNRQALPTYYRLNGAIFIARVDYFRKQKSFHGPETFAYVMPSERSLDIDTPMDFKIAEIVFHEKSLQYQGAACGP